MQSIVRVASDASMSSAGTGFNVMGPVDMVFAGQMSAAQTGLLLEGTTQLTFTGAVASGTAADPILGTGIWVNSGDNAGEVSAVLLDGSITATNRAFKFSGDGTLSLFVGTSAVIDAGVLGLELDVVGPASVKVNADITAQSVFGNSVVGTGIDFTAQTGLSDMDINESITAGAVGIRLSGPGRVDLDIGPNSVITAGTSGIDSAMSNSSLVSFGDITGLTVGSGGFVSGTGIFMSGNNNVSILYGGVTGGSFGLVVDGEGNDVTVFGDVNGGRGAAINIAADLTAVQGNTLIFRSDVSAELGGVTVGAGGHTLSIAAGSTVEATGTGNGNGATVGNASRLNVSGTVIANAAFGIGVGISGGEAVVVGTVMSGNVGVSMNGGINNAPSLPVDPRLVLQASGLIDAANVGVETFSGAARITVCGRIEAGDTGILVSTVTEESETPRIVIDPTGVTNAPVAIRSTASTPLGNTNTVPSLILVNNGSLLGSVELGAGDDRVANNGSLTFVDLGAGDDRYTGSDTDERVRDGAGDDIITLGGGGDVLTLVGAAAT